MLNDEFDAQVGPTPKFCVIQLKHSLIFYVRYSLFSCGTTAKYIVLGSLHSSY